MCTSDNYFIKNNYISNEINSSYSDEYYYWNKIRIILSKYYQFYVYKYAMGLLRKNDIRSIVDIGCGVGTKLKFIHNKFPDIKYIGIDQKNAINYCKKKYDFGNWYIDDIENPNINFDRIKGDLVLSSDVIEHLTKPNFLIKNIKKIVNKNGLILISTPERDRLRGINCLNSPNENHVREWNSSEFKQYLEFNGFKILKHEMQLPIRITLPMNMEYLKIFYSEIIRRIISRKPLRYNQLFLLKLN